MELLGTSGIWLAHGSAFMDPPVLHCPLRRIYTEVSGSGTVAYSSFNSAGTLYTSWTANSATSGSGFVPAGGRVYVSSSPSGDYRAGFSAVGGTLQKGSATASFTSTSPTGSIGTDTKELRSAVFYGYFDGPVFSSKVDLTGWRGYAIIPETATSWLPSLCYDYISAGDFTGYYIAGYGWKSAAVSALNVRVSATPLPPEWTAVHFSGHHSAQAGNSAVAIYVNPGEEYDESGARGLGSDFGNALACWYQPDQELYYAGSYLMVGNRPTYMFSGVY